MKKVVIIGLSALLAACASETYVTDVTSDSYREDYAVDTIQQPVVSNQGAAQGVYEKDIAVKKVQPEVVQMTAPQSEAKITSTAPVETTVATSTVALKPPSAKQLAMNPRYGYTIQVVAVGSEDKVSLFANRLPGDQPIWENYKMVNGTQWFTVLYGDYATHKEAASAIQRLPADLRSLKPFVKSIDDIKNSQFPTMNKLN